MALVLTHPVHAQENQSEPPATFLTRAKKGFEIARTQFHSEPNNAGAAINFGRAAFDWAEFAANNKQREEIALQGIDACRQAVAQTPKSTAAHYYLAMNLGQLARTKSIGALKLVTEMEREFQIARELDEKFDFAGPDRNLGLLYFEAPGWPASVGDRNEARRHLRFAVTNSPGYPENRLNLLTAYLKWGDKSEARREYAALQNLWPDAKKEFSGERWELSWADWEKRWRTIQAKIFTEKILESPRQRK